MFTTGGIGWYLLIGAIAYAITRGRGAVAHSVPTDPTTGLPVTVENGPLEVPPALRAPVLMGPTRAVCIQSLCPDGSARSAIDCSCPDGTGTLLAPIRMSVGGGGFI